MRYRHWLLVAAGLALFYSTVLIRLDFFMQLLPSYGEADIHASAALAVALLFAWVALEACHFRATSRGRCPCGYSLKGVKCPECGRDLGDGAL